MSDFGDISRMNLADLERKGYQPEEEDDSDDMALPAAGPEGAEQTEDGEESEAGHEPEVEVVDNRERMAEPTGKHYYIDAKITPREMRAFLFAHNYRSPIMLLATLVGLVWPVYTVIRADGSLMMAVVCALVFLVLMPFSIWYRGTNSVTKNPIYQNTFHYMLDESGIHLELGEHAIDVDWNQVTKTMFLKSSAVIYTGKINAYLIPTEAMGDRKDEIISFIRQYCH
ncbi:MAG: hypothetical protein IJI25_00685 [Eubacterium sp.]|nr:hypothetical protein [Eubacterium sp.]